jgi:hypothetical protein
LVAAKVQPWVDLINFLESLPQVFDLDTATGQALDFCGEWIGFPRAVLVPLDPVFFTLDDPDNVAATGLDAGIWFLPFEPLVGVTNLPDDIYRSILRAKVGLNRWDSTIGQLVSILVQLFAPATISVTDGMDMSISVAVTGTPSSALFKQIVLAGYLPLKPAGVTITYSFS